MPFVSEAQRRFAYATNAPWKDEFAAATPKGAKLPQHVAGATTHSMRHAMRDHYERSVARKRKRTHGRKH